MHARMSLRVCVCGGVFFCVCLLVSLALGHALRGAAILCEDGASTKLSIGDRGGRVSTTAHHESLSNRRILSKVGQLRQSRC